MDCLGIWLGLPFWYLIIEFKNDSLILNSLNVLKSSMKEHSYFRKGVSDLKACLDYSYQTLILKYLKIILYTEY